MCGRFTQLLTWQQVHYLYEIPATEVPPLLQPRYNGAPTQDFALCRMGQTGKGQLDCSAGV